MAEQESNGPFSSRRLNLIIMIVGFVFLAGFPVVAMSQPAITAQPFNSTWTWTKSGSLFCVTQTPETVTNKICKTTAQLTMNSLMPQLHTGDVIDFHNVRITTGFTLDFSTTGILSLTFRNGVFFYSSGQTFTINGNAGVTDEFKFYDFLMNMTGNTSIVNSLSVTNFVNGILFERWTVCCGAFRDTVDVSTFGASLIAWNLHDTTTSGGGTLGNPATCAIILSSASLVKDSQFYNNDCGIDTASGTTSQIVGNDFGNGNAGGGVICIKAEADTIISNNAFNGCSTAAINQQDPGSSSNGIQIFQNQFTSNGANYVINGAGCVPVSNCYQTLLFGNVGINPKGTFAVTITASPFIFTDSVNVLETLYIQGGTITSIVKNGVTLFAAISSNEEISLYPGQSVTVTYTVAPSMTVDQF